MELSERYIKKLEEEGFDKVYEWQNPAGTEFSEHAHPGKMAVMVTDGSITYDFSGEKKEVQAGQRLDIPAGAVHSAVAGSNGWIAVIGEHSFENIN